jgi:hypothetical protein
MSSDLRKQIYNSFNLKETEELLEIWQENDRVEWSETTFEVLQEILQQRLGELPPQGAPLFEHTDVKDDEEIEPDDDNPPEFYKPREVLWLEKWLYRAAIASIVAAIVASLLELPRMQNIVWSYFTFKPESNSVAWLISIVIFFFVVGLQCILLYFPLKALGSILKILMEMEFNSRIPKTKNA